MFERVNTVIIKKEELSMNFVSASQAFESELSVRVAALLQQRVTLTVENTRLKQQMARLRQQKLFMEGQHLRISFH